jgi:NAD(P)-dependent dehydrogenase (short-subunit alcohol dehydrogenase family)
LADGIEGPIGEEALTLAINHLQKATRKSMARVFITGSADGLGRMAAELMIELGHRVVLHARNRIRADKTKRNIPEAEGVVIGDLGTIAQTRNVAEQINALGAFDAIIHNAAVGHKEPKRIETEDGLSHVFAVNTLAPYILTALIAKPKRLVYLSSSNRAPMSARAVSVIRPAGSIIARPAFLYVLSGQGQLHASGDL